LVDLVLAFVAIVVGFVVVVLFVLAVAWLWFRLGARRARKRFGDAEQFIRRRGGDPRLTRRLADLADDPRTPRSARAWLDRLVRYRHEPVVLAPEWVPVLGWLDEVTIESFLLRQAWRSLPPAVWDEYFSDAPSLAARTASRSVERSAAPVPAGLGALLRELDAAGRHDELLRTLDRRLPEWEIGTTVIAVARELLELERNVATARTLGVPEAVTERLAGEARVAAAALWDLADRLVAAASFGVSSGRLDERLAEEEIRLGELRNALREARTGLAELTLAGAGGRDDLDRAERRFRALARTAEELQELER
jgi:uncharacterized membrane protein YkvA (DUF1232 family)